MRIMFFRYLAARAHMGVIGIRARFRIWLAARSDVLIFLSILLLPAVIIGAITALTAKSVLAAFLVGAICFAVEIYKIFESD